MRTLGLLCLCLCWIGCDDDAPRRAITFDVAVDNGSVMVPVDDGARVPFSWGFQGGTMIQPGVLLPIEVAEGVETVRLTVRHRPDPSDPEAFGDAGDYADVVQDVWLRPYDADRMLAGPVDQQLGRADLGGMRLLLDVSVVGPGFEGRETVRVEVEAGATPCSDFPSSGATCVYHSLPLDMRVAEHAPAPDCPGAVIPMIEYFTDSPGLGLCAEWLGIQGQSGVLPVPGLTGGADAACLDEMGLGLDASVSGDVAVQGKGTCAPFVLEPSEDFSACVICD